MRELGSLFVGIVLGAGGVYFWQPSAVATASPTHPAAQVAHQATTPIGQNKIDSVAIPSATPPATPDSCQPAAPSEALPKTAEYPETDLPHPIFGYFRNKVPNFTEWDKTLEQELTDYQWQSQMELTVRNALGVNPDLKGLKLSDLSCRQSGCRLKLILSGTFDAITVDQINMLEAVEKEPWISYIAGAQSRCTVGKPCEVLFYFPRDPTNDSDMEVIPWRRRG